MNFPMSLNLPGRVAAASLLAFALTLPGCVVDTKVANNPTQSSTDDATSTGPDGSTSLDTSATDAHSITGTSGPTTESISSSTAGLETDTGDTDTGEPSALCPEHTAADACCCFEAHVNLSSSVDNVCGTTSLCPAAEFECNDIDQTCATTDEAAVNCMLDALAVGTMVGSLTVHYDVDDGYGQRKIDLYLQGDRTAYVADKEELDISGWFKPTGLYTLREATYFDTCRAAVDLQVKADCLKDLVAGAASEICIDAFEYET